MARVFDFGPFRLDDRERTLLRDGVPIKLAPKAFDVLLLLLSRPNSLVEKSTILQSVWGGVHVEEAVLARAISDLRKAITRDGDPAWIETVPKYGYRLHADVRLSGSVSPPRTLSIRLRLALTTALLAAAAILAGLIGYSHARTEDHVQHLLILPFQTLGDSSGRASLGVGVADSLITRLSNLQGLIVRPLASVPHPETAAADPLRTAKELGADAVLEGTLRFADGSVRAGIRLIRASDGAALWSDTLESRENRLFALEDSIAEQIAQKLALRLTDAERRDLAVRHQLNPEAHLLYLEGRYEWGKRTRDGFERAAELFRRAIDLDPTYGRAYAGLADCYLLLGAYAIHPQLETLPKAKQTVLRALELDPALAEAHATLGLVTQNLDWDWPAVERHYREAIRLAPNYATAHHWYAEFLSILGRFDESEAEFTYARKIDPISPIIPVDEAQLYFFQRDYARSLKLLEKVRAEYPSFALARERIAITYMLQGRDEEALREAMTLPECASTSSDCRLTWTAWLPSLNPDASRAALAQLASAASAGRVPAYALLYAYARHGHTSHALDVYERMLSTHAVMLITSKVNPFFDPIRSQPRAQPVLAQLHLGPVPTP